MIQAIGEGRHLQTGRCFRHAAIGPSLGRGDVDGGDQGFVGGRQLRLRAGAGGDGQRRFLAASDKSDCGCSKEKRGRR